MKTKLLSAFMTLGLLTLAGCSDDNESKAASPSTAPSIPQKTMVSEAVTNAPVIQKGIKLYAQANDKSKVITEISPQQQSNYNPIFKNADGWIKVGDTTNGNTGWVKPVQNKSAQLKAELIKIQQRQQHLAESYQQESLQARKTELAIIQQLNRTNGITVIPKLHKIPRQEQFHSTSVRYSSNNKDGMAKVTKSWLDKNGEIKTKTFTIPISELNGIAVQR
ncbi:MAG: hypothetical protein ACJA0H_000553 [Francisellaceae bacterium]|jgi:hypothetical protein